MGAGDAFRTQRVFFRTFGCQMNEYDTGKLRALLARDGYAEVDDPALADLVLLNTCSVRDKAVQKMHSALGAYRRLKREGHRLIIGIGGCVPQMLGQELFERYPDVDLVFGPDGVPRIRDLVHEARAGRRVLDTEFLDLAAYPFVPDVDPACARSVGACVTIQKGCDQKCTYCVVPFTRGGEVSRPHEPILEEVRRLVDLGVREITLIGQNVNAYGTDLPGGISFAELLWRVSRVEGVWRIRYTSSHPKDVTDDLVAVYREVPEVVSHLHLPVQSGSNRILRRMNRFYTRERFLSIAEALRAARPDLVLTTDLIVGFPGETEADFGETMRLVDEVPFEGAYSFCYSPRPGTAALRLGDEVAREVASRRLTELQSRLRARTSAWHRSLEGQVHEVLVEGWSRDDPAVACGRTRTNAIVNFPGISDDIGKLVRVRVTRGFTNSCRGERIP